MRTPDGSHRERGSISLRLASADKMSDSATKLVGWISIIRSEEEFETRSTEQMGAYRFREAVPLTAMEGVTAQTG